MRTVVLFPTAGEAEAFRRRCPGVAYRITGVGPAAAAAATARAIVDERPDLLLLAGIAGVYPASEVAVGEVVAVAAALGVPAAEVRAVSNRVGEPFGVWRVADACEALARELALLVGEIGSVSSQDRLPLRRSAGGVGKGR